MIKYFCDMCDTQIPPNGQYVLYTQDGPENGAGEYRFCEKDGMAITQYVKSLLPPKADSGPVNS